MPTYRVTGEDGTVYEVDGPEGVSREQILAKIRSDLSEQNIKERREAYLEGMNRFGDLEYERGPEDSSFLGNIGRGLGAGFVNTLENSALGLATLLDEGAELTARDAIKGIADSIKPELTDPEAVSTKLAQGVGSILGFVPAAFTGPAAPAVVAGMALSGGAGEASERARAAGATEEERSRAALLGTIPGAFDIIPLARLSKKFAPDVVTDLVNKFGKPEIDGIGSRIRRAFTTGGIEGAQETAQGIAQNLIEKGYNEDAELLKGAGEEGLVGAGAGAIVQGLLDAFVGRGARRGTTGEPTQDDPTQDDPTQDIFPELRDVDLGTAPTRGPTRGELFPDAELGTAPERADDRQDDRQLNLFDTRASELRQRVLDLEAERQRIIDSPIAPFEVEGDSFFERINNEIQQARAELATIEGRATAPVVRPEPTQLDFGAELDRQQTEQQQVAAREREALDAIERGDEATFAQPDLFPQEAAAARTVAEETAALRRMGRQEATPEVTPATPTRDPRQTDLVDAVRTAEFLEAEENTLREAEAQEAAVRDESARESIEGQLAAETTTDLEVTTPERQRVLDSVLTDLGTASRANTTQRFSSALAAAGIANTAPTAAERRAIDSATDVVAATRIQRDDTPPAGPVPTRQEARAEAAAQRETADQTAAEQRRNRRILTEEDLAWGPKRIKELKGQDVGNPGPARDTLQTQLETLRKNAEGLKQPRAINNNQEKQQKILELLGEQPLTASATSDIATTPTPEQVIEEEQVQGAQDAGQQFDILGESIDASEIDDAPARKSDAAPVPAATPTVGGDTTGPAAPTTARVDTPAASLGRAIGRAGKQLGALEPVETTAEIKKKRAAKKKAAAIKTKISKAAAKAKAPAKKKTATSKAKAKTPVKKKATTPRSKPSSPATVVTPRKGPEPTEEQLERISRAANPPEARRVREELEKEGVTFFTKPSRKEDRIVQATKSDADKIINLLENPPSILGRAKRAGEARATTELRDARTYLSIYENPIDALEVMAYDYVFSPKAFRLGEKGAFTDAERQLLKGTGAKPAQNALRWAATNLDESTVKQLKEFVTSEKRTFTSQRSAELSNIDPVAQKREVDATEAASKAIVQEDYGGATAPLAVSQEDLALLDRIDALPDVESADLDIKAIEEVASFDADPGLDLRADAVVGLDMPAHPVVSNLLRDGNLVKALQTLAATSPSGRVRQIANKLAQKLGDTKVEVVENLTDAAGVRVAGLFDPKTNTIKIDAETGVNPHTILHETTHALTSATLANKSHPVTKQLEKLFNQLKEQGALDSFYGSQSLDEFVAEAFGNPEFQTKLASINPDGSPISALQRFFNTIGNFVRRMLGMKTKSVDSALNQADNFIEAMLAPAPESRNAGSLYLKNASEMMDGLNRIAKSFPKLSPRYRKDFVNSVYEFFSTANPAKRRARDVLFMAAPLQALTDVAQRYGIKSAFQLHKVIQNMVGAQSRAEARVDGTLKVMQGWIKTATDEQVQSFNNLVYDSTTQQVDPYAPESTYANNAEKLAAWKAMQKDVKAVGPGGKKTYIELRESYKRQFNELQKVINRRIDGLKDANGDPLNKEAKEKLKTDVFDKIFAKGRIEPYFPLTRQGDKWLQYNTKVTDAQGNTTTEPVYMAFKTVYERNQFIKSLKGNPDVVGEPRPYENIKEAVGGAQSNAPKTSFINDTMQLLAGVDQEVRDEFTQLFLNALPESSFAKSMVSRKNEGKGELGFDKDAESAFRYKAYNLASQIERMRYSEEIDNTMQTLREEAESYGNNNPDDQPNTNAAFEELARRASFAKNPPEDKTASLLNRIAFVGTIGFNISSAFVNLSQIPLMFQPLLGGTYGQANAVKGISNAFKIVTGSGKSRKIGTMLGGEADATGMPSIDNYYQEITDAEGNVTLKIRDDLEVDAARRKELEDLMPLVEMAAAQGQLNRSIFYDTLGVELTGREKGVWDYTNAWSAFMFHQVERLNRQVAMVSTYQLELNKLREKGGMTDAEMKNAAAETAIYKAQEMNGGAFLATAPRIAQSGWGRVAMMYKTFGVQMYYTILKTAKAALDKSDPEVQRQSIKALVGVLTSSMLMAGFQGLPMIGAVFAIANLFLDDDEDDAETIARKIMGEGFYKGGINALTGMDVAARFGLGNLLFRLNPYSQDQSAVEIAAQAVGGPALSVISQFVRGVGDAADGNLQRGVETMLPSAFRNVAKSMRYSELFGEGAIKSRRGDVIYDDISTGEVFGQLLGFAPAEYTLIQEKNMASKRIDRAVNKERTQALRELYIATRMGDYDGVLEAREKINKFNAKNPNFAISGRTMGKSMRQHVKTSATMFNGVTISPRMRIIIQQQRDDYWGQPDNNLLRMIDFD